MDCDIKMKDIKGYEGLYAVTSCGKVWSYKKERFICQWSNGTPYLLVTLCKKGVKKNRRVARLVAEAYVTNPDPKRLKKVDHENQNPRDNYVSNLRWVDTTINCCNRKNNIPIMDISTCEIYCCLARAIKATEIKRKQILEDCDYYCNYGEAKRFVYFDKLSEAEMKKFIWDFCDRQCQKKKNKLSENDMRKGA